MKRNILIISNNCFSKNKSNGKTLYNLFKSFSLENIYQLFFSPEEIEREIDIGGYFRISDKDVLKNIFCRNSVGTIAEAKESKIYEKEVGCRHKGNVCRLAREIVWKLGASNLENLDMWLKGVNPDIIFFLAGDAVFAYDICNHCRQVTGAELFVYITDDYLVRRKCDSLSFEIRRQVLLKRVKSTLENTQQLFVISEKMREKYLNLFGKDSKILVNLDSFESIEDNIRCGKQYYTMIYAGNLYYGREETLLHVLREVEAYNAKTYGKRWTIDVYTDISLLSPKWQEEVTHYTYVRIKPQIDRNALEKVYNNADGFLFLEGLRYEDYERVRYAFSTKITELLHFDVPILAVGHKEDNSMCILEECAFCITDSNELKNVEYFLENARYREHIALKNKRVLKKVLSEIADLKVELLGSTECAI